MESASSKHPLTSKSVRSPFVTPCRRMGLSKTSPGGSWHANKSPLYKSPMKDIENSEESLQTNEDHQNHQNTPFKNRRRLNKCNLIKRMKTEHLSSSLASSNLSTSPNSSLKIQNNEAEEKNRGTVEINEPSRELDLETDQESDVIPSEKDITAEALHEVQMRVKKKEEILQELKLHQLYKKKHDVTTLQTLSQTWLQGCQAALQELLSFLLTQGHQLNMEELLQQLNIPHQLVKYNTDLEEFE